MGIMHYLEVTARSELNELGFRVIPNDQHTNKRMLDIGDIEYETILMNTCLQYIPPYGTAIDCGAMYGNYTQIFRKNTLLYGQVIAIEPGLLAFECLKFNLYGSLGRTITINAGLCEAHGGFLRHKVTDDRGSSLVTEWDHTGDNIVRMSIDGIIKDHQIDRVDLIKMTCQGWEYRVLKGAVETLKSMTPVLMIEINHEQLKMHNHTFNDIKNLLESVDYGYEIIQKDLNEKSPQFNILASIFHRQINIMKFCGSN